MSGPAPVSGAAPEGVTYASAGVDTEAGDLAVELMKGAVRATHGPQVLGGVGGFAGLYDFSAVSTYRRPLLATSTDGVGTKVAIAQAMDVHHTIGFDLVGMVVDDIVVVGATPLFMTDYIATGKVVPQRIADIVRGIAEACTVAGTALVGGETAEHPGLLAPDEYDVAGAATGVVEADELLGPERVRAGDVLVAMGSSGLHSNGYSLVRAVVRQAGWDLGRHVPEFGRTLGEELLEPTRVYALDCLALAHEPAAQVHAFTHVTGGGLAANLARVLPRGLVATVDRGSWVVPPVFSVVRDLGGVPRHDLESTLNLGVGMVAVVGPEGVDRALALCAARGVEAWVLGSVKQSDGVAAGSGAVVSGTKGVDGGAVLMAGDYRTS
ncbi:phosphoribosylformylglycinamidine cyclo-ligase [Actinotalea sp. K2]|uniref:phosphoribosylformylglycinamidine cyclo-ligase n=1 Tax=Actinotalea sp. K2 TaxID=2939438 RepID=UPI002016AFDF|nr:phosphoribosylformylglycinamidine cyclo-ligase [Actinotalea sp. K2]MCL3863120.1 phosphoribosylformylglycinamidine cyclo-ligase [Actinotalea sp. K2]